VLGEDEIRETAILPSEMARNASQLPADLAQPALSESQAIGAASILPGPHLPSAIYLTDAMNTRQGRSKS
jgi:hypothetical protein